jgi:hypothetical protein
MRNGGRPQGPRFEPWAWAPIAIALAALVWMTVALMRR